MDLEAAKVIGAGLAAIGVGAAAAGVGIVFGSFLQGALRNPAAADGQQGEGDQSDDELGHVGQERARLLRLGGEDRRRDGQHG